MKTNTEEFRYRFRNPDNSSVFRSELAANREALNLALDNRASETWILTDSKSSIQFIKDWFNVLDMLGQDILLKLAALTQVSSLSKMWHNNDRLSFSSVNNFYNLPGHDDVWQLRKPDGAESIEMHQKTAASNDDLSSLDSWTQTVMTSRSSLASSMMSIDSTGTGISSPSLKLNLDNVTWTTTKQKRRRHKYKKNIQASSAKVRAVMKQSKTPQFRFRMILLTLFALIVTIVSFTWHMYQQQLLQIAIGDKIRFHEGRRILHLLKDDGQELVAANLGNGIPNDLNPYQCDIHSTLARAKICEEWKYRAKLHLNFSHTTNLSCYNVHWTSLEWNTVLRDCIALKSAHWYGMGLQRGLQWPLRITPGESSHPLVTGDGVEEMFGGIIDRYWLSSDGVAIFVEPDVPLYVSINKDYLCLEARRSEDFPYQTVHPIALKYTICTGKDIRSLHQDMMLNYRSLLADTSNRVFLMSPIWVASPRKVLSQESIQEFANRIMEHTSKLPGFLLLDSRWQSLEGSLDFNETNFPNPREILKILHNKGFRVLLTVHPYVCLPSRIFEQANADRLLVSDKWKKVPLLTKWQNKVCGLLDFTNNVTSSWFLDRLLKLKEKYGIDGFVFTGGQTTYLPRYYSYHVSSVNPDLFLPHYLSLANKLNSILGTEVGFLSQNFPGFVRLTPRTVSWDSLSGLGSVIPEILTLGILGYPLVNPGSVGGDGSGEIPSKELYLRWMELVVFLPIVQFTIAPGDYDQEVVDAVYQLFSIREEHVLPIYKTALEQFPETAAPLVRPLWWIAPEDAHAQMCGSQFLVGEEIMVAPILEDGRRTRDIYLPAGWWKDHLLDEVRRGGKWLHNYPVPLTKVAYFSVTTEPS
ncbi:myogenesis-regulating glycosidase [Trichonephila clavata]|uniref:Myogenesis-regulating glycosidase n=1 Tax=Trichonephila clavata TaxID=2740835 RepID=A0A8X6LLM1_TRICU|nr:myogenesis-regulating glycosidase [Trichonephila clavata]